MPCFLNAFQLRSQWREYLCVRPEHVEHVRELLVNTVDSGRAAWAAEDEEDPHSTTVAKNSTTGADASWAASCEDDTTSGVSLAIKGPGSR